MREVTFPLYLPPAVKVLKDETTTKEETAKCLKEGPGGDGGPNFFFPICGIPC